MSGMDTWMDLDIYSDFTRDFPSEPRPKVLKAKYRVPRAGPMPMPMSMNLVPESEAVPSRAGRDLLLGGLHPLGKTAPKPKILKKKAEANPVETKTPGPKPKVLKKKNC